MHEVSLMLEDIGATGFSYGWQKDGDEQIVQVNFQYQGLLMAMPLSVGSVAKYLERSHRKWPEDKIIKQARRTAARQIREHVYVLFASAKMGMAPVHELFLANIVVKTKDGTARIGEMLTAPRLLEAQNRPLLEDRRDK